MRIDNVPENREGPSGCRMRVIVAPEDVLLRAALASRLEHAAFVMGGRAGDAEEPLALARKNPEPVVVDIRTPPTHTGLEAARAIRREFPRTAVLPSAHIEVEHGRELLGGAAEECTPTRDRLVRGGTLIHPAVVCELDSAR